MCGKHGHAIWNCYHRFDYNFYPSQPSGHNTNYISNQNSNHKPQGQLSAFIASPETIVCDPNWYADMGTSSHLTLDALNLGTKSDYSDQDLVHAGNGAGLPIKSIGHSYFNSDSIPSKSSSCSQYYKKIGQCFQTMQR